MDQDHEKKVDESWKSSVAAPIPEPTFSFFISTMGMQAFLALGEIADPVTSEKKTDLIQAKYLIDMVDMLRQKTHGNLSEEEGAMVKQLLYDLRIKFVSKVEESGV